MDPGELVDVFARVLGVGDAEAKLEVERLEQFVTEEMAFDHPEVVDGLRTNREFNTATRENTCEVYTNKQHHVA